MSDKLVAIDTADPQGSRFASAVNDEIEFIVGQLGGGGNAGPAGPTGLAGPKGDTGAVGPAGPVSTTPGPTGDTGVAGVKGDTGTTGAAGVKGDTGTTGAAGVKGAAGVAGPDGVQGIQGVQGAPGLGIIFRGTVATVGALPATGTQGDLYVVESPVPAHSWVWDDAAAAYVDGGIIQGPQGAAGPAGSDGAVGAKGDTGATGPAGADGTAVGMLPLAGGTMTGAIALPTGVNGLTITGNSYNLLGGNGGIAFRNGTANIVNFSGASVQMYVPILTPATGTGIQFGSGGPTLGKSGTTIASSALITVAAAPVAANDLTNKTYVDSRVVITAAGGATPATTGLADGALWVTI
jgi:hypothetical protein